LELIFFFLDFENEGEKNQMMLEALKMMLKGWSDDEWDEWSWSDVSFC